MKNICCNFKTGVKNQPSERSLPYQPQILGTYLDYANGTVRLFAIDIANLIAVFRIRNILVRIWILGSVPLTNRSGSCSFRQ